MQSEVEAEAARVIPAASKGAMEPGSLHRENESAGFYWGRVKKEIGLEKSPLRPILTVALAEAQAHGVSTRN